MQPWAAAGGCWTAGTNRIGASAASLLGSPAALDDALDAELLPGRAEATDVMRRLARPREYGTDRQVVGRVSGGGQLVRPCTIKYLLFIYYPSSNSLSACNLVSIVVGLPTTVISIPF